MDSSNEGQRAYHGFKMVEPGEVGISPNGSDAWRPSRRDTSMRGGCRAW